MITEVLPTLRPPEGLLDGPTWTPAAVSMAALAAITCLGWGGFVGRRWLSRDRRKETPVARARDALAGLAADGAGPVDMFELSRVFQHFLRSVCGEGMGERTAVEWETHLRGCSGLDSEWVGEVIGFLGACEAQKFGPVAVTSAAASVATARQLVDRWGATGQALGPEEGTP